MFKYLILFSNFYIRGKVNTRKKQFNIGKGIVWKGNIKLFYNFNI